MASGLSLIFGMMRVVNFAHGAFYMIGAYAFTYLMMAGIPFWIALVGGSLIVALMGMLIEMGTLRRLYGTNEINPLLLTLGFGFVIVDGIRLAFGLGGIPTQIPEGFQGMVNLGFMIFPKYRAFIVLASAVLVFSLWLFIYKTNIGIVIRAGTKDNEMVQMLGINVRRVWTLVFSIGIGMAALAGALYAPISGTVPEMGEWRVIEAFVVVVIGGMGSLTGSIVAGLLVGETIALSTFIYGPAGNVSIFIIMIIILLTTKAGLFGEELA